jgi:hypothetical protein
LRWSLGRVPVTPTKMKILKRYKKNYWAVFKNLLGI